MGSQALAVIKHNDSRVSILEPNNLTELQDLGTLMAQSGFFQDARQAAQACVKILAGREMGFPPIASMVGISIINGKPATGANLLAAAMKRAGYTWKVHQRDAKGCKITVSFQGEELGPAEFIEEDAQRAGLLGKQTWKQFPKSMYFARTISDAARTYAPEVMAGLPAYTAEEMGADNVTEDGSLIAETKATEKIDIGGHLMNTQAAADYVAQKQIAEIKARRESAAPAPPAEPTPKPKETISVPDPVQEIYAKMGTKKESIGQVLGDLKFELGTFIGDSAALRKSNDMFDTFGSPFAKVGNARAIALGLWTEIQAAKKNQEDAALHGHKSAVLEDEPEQAILIPQEVGYGVD